MKRRGFSGRREDPNNGKHMIRQVADDLWAFEKNLRLPGGMLLPSRTAIVRAGDGGLVLHSPLDIDDEAAKRIDELGEVRWIVAPSCVHYLYVRAAKERWPDASVVGAPGLEKKMKDVPFEPLPRTGQLFSGALDVTLIEGTPGMNEHVFLHTKSRSLIVTDLVFNVHRTDSFMMQFFLRIVGAWKRTAQSRMWRFLVKDRAAAAESARRALEWSFDRVVVAHGDVVEGDARARLEHALQWMLSGAPKLLAQGSST